MRQEPLLELKDLRITFPSPRGTVRAVNGLNLTVRPGEVVGIVGESGSGKSVSAYALMGLLGPTGRIESGTALFDGTDLLSLPEEEKRLRRGREIGMIFQDPMTTLDPAFRIGDILTEVIRTHRPGRSRRAAWQEGAEMLRAMGIRDAEAVMRSYQSSLSGGMRQRVMIAAALLPGPRLLIADEPTTALDVTIQNEIIELIREAKDQRGMSVLFITHNFGIVAELCDRVTVMYGGSVMEEGTVDELFYRTAHPYTAALLSAIPRLDGDRSAPLVHLEGQPVDATDLPPGCVFAPRCSKATEVCRGSAPALTYLGGEHSAACHHLGREVLS